MTHAHLGRRDSAGLPPLLPTLAPNLVAVIAIVTLGLALLTGSRDAMAAGAAHLGSSASPRPAPPGPAASPGPEMSLRSCVDGSPPLRLAASAAQARLDAGDRQRFQSAAEARYPLYQRGGLQPAQVLMLRRGSQWLYVTLGQDGRSGGPCVTAVFAAERFAFTPSWLAKYQPRAAERDD